jgi:hypothetical protein
MNEYFPIINVVLRSECKYLTNLGDRVYLYKYFNLKKKQQQQIKQFFDFLFVIVEFR